jgi:hypothetical protein
MKLIWNFTLVLLIVVLLTGFSSVIGKSMSQGIGKNNPDNPILNSTWISKRDSLNMSLSLDPRIPIVDQKTTLNFDIKKITDTDSLNGLTAKLTITDQDGRLYKFNNELFSIINGKFSVDYFFLSGGDNKVIVQLYNNTRPMMIGSFDIIVPSSSASGNTSPGGSSDSNIFANLFGNLFK